MKRKCRYCKSIQNTLDFRSKKNPKLRTALKRKTKDEQVAWFRHQKRQRLGADRSTPYNFDDLEFVEEEVKSTGTEMRARVHWLPFSVWKEEQIEKEVARGRLDFGDEGAVELFGDTLKARWEDLCRGSDLKKTIEGVLHAIALVTRHACLRQASI